MVEISASLLNLNKENANRKIYDKKKKKIDCFHIDVMDGQFVENNNVDLMKDYALITSHISNLGIDVHLMVNNIEEFVEEYLSLSPRIITFHIESSKDEDRTLKLIKKIKESGTKVGIAISPDTNIDEIKKYLGMIHMVLVMTVIPGKGGQSLIPKTIQKIKNLREYINEKKIDIDIEADGGINGENAKDVIKAGANILVIGTYLLNSENYFETVKSIKTCY